MYLDRIYTPHIALVTFNKMLFCLRLAALFAFCADHWDFFSDVAVNSETDAQKSC